MKITTEQKRKITKEDYKKNQERLRKEILRIETLKLNSSGSRKYIKQLKKDLSRNFQNFKTMEEDKENVRGSRI